MNTDGALSSGEKLQQVTEQENMSLMSDIVLEEVRDAIFSMHPERSPGPDGLNPAFFQVLWDVVKRDLVDLCQKFIATGELPKGVNKTLVCLIPKVRQPQTMADLCHISVCNVVIRVLSKVLTNRLKPCLQMLISDRQSTFIEGRLLTNNALIAFEINHYMIKRTLWRKIDISKAYDKLEWGYVTNMLKRYGISGIWIDRIMGFI